MKILLKKGAIVGFALALTQPGTEDTFCFKWTPMPPEVPAQGTCFNADTAGPQRTVMVAMCAPPIASVICALRQSRAIMADAASANEMIGSLVKNLDPTDMVRGMASVVGMTQLHPVASAVAG